MAPPKNQNQEVLPMGGLGATENLTKIAVKRARVLKTNLQQACKDVLENNMSIRESAERNKISKSTLGRELSKIPEYQNRERIFAPRSRNKRTVLEPGTSTAVEANHQLKEDHSIVKDGCRVTLEWDGLNPSSWRVRSAEPIATEPLDLSLKTSNTVNGDTAHRAPVVTEVTPDRNGGVTQPTVTSVSIVPGMPSQSPPERATGTIPVNSFSASLANNQQVLPTWAPQQPLATHGVPYSGMVPNLAMSYYLASMGQPNYMPLLNLAPQRWTAPMFHTPQSTSGQVTTQYNPLLPGHSAFSPFVPK